MAGGGASSEGAITLEVKLAPPWRETYYGIRLGEKGKSVLDIFIDLRAEEFLFELRILHEKALHKVSRMMGEQLRRERLNPNLRSIDTLI